MINTTLIYGSTIALVSGLGLRRWYHDKEDGWYPALYRGISDDTTTLWKAITGQRSKKDIEWERVTLTDSQYKALTQGKSALEKEFYSLNDTLRNELEKTTGKDINKLVGQLDDKRKELIDATQRFNNWVFEHAGSSVKQTVNQATEKVTDVVKKNIPDTKTHKVDSIAARGLEGWGETAAEFAREEAEESNDYTKANQISSKIKHHYDESELAKKAVANLEGWGENAAQFAKDEYDELTKK